MEIFERFKKGMKDSGNEHGQGVIRFAANAVLTIYSVLWLSTRHEPWFAIFAPVPCTYSLLVLAHILFFPKSSSVRRVLATCADISLATIFLFNAGQDGAMYFFMFTFVTIGNGFRYGARSLAATGALGTLGILTLILFSPSWADQVKVGVGMLITHITVTAYTGMLLGRMRGMKSQAAEDHMMLRAIIDASPAIVFVKGIDGRVLLVNKKYEEALYLQSHDLIGKLESEIFPSDIAAKFAAADALVASTGKDYQFEDVAPHTDGLHTYFSVKFPIFGKDGKIIAVGGIASDVTELKKAESERADLLVREKSAIEASAMKSSFLATMSHELRTPINGVMGMADLLRMTPLTSEQLSYADIVTQSADTLLTLVNDILDLSKAEAGKIDIENLELEIEKIVSEVNGSLGLAAKRKGLELSFEIDRSLPRAFRGDPTRLRQVLANLVGNAIKFTNVGHVHVRIKSVESAKVPTARFEIEDTGIGIPDSIKPKLFRAFSQADASTTRKYGGSGLGLSICKHLVTLLGGEIGVEDRTGGGTRLWFSVPYGMVMQTAHVEKIPVAGKESRAYNVLLAEDNSTNQLIGTKILEKLGCTVHSAKNGTQVLAALEKARFDLIFMDCQMPEMDGFEATRKIRASSDQALRDIPIVALTANAMTGDREQCLAAGMNDYVSKPFRSTDLQTVLERVMNPKGEAA